MQNDISTLGLRQKSGAAPASNVLVIALDAAGPLDITGDRVLVVAPAVESRLRPWLSDDDEARRAAGKRLDGCLGRLTRAGVDATGCIGHADPVEAIANALTTFAADEVVVTAHVAHARRLAGDVVRRARERFDLPIVEDELTISRAA